MHEITDDELLNVAAAFGRIEGSEALAEIADWTDCHARRIISGYRPKSINNKHKRALLRRLPELVSAIEEGREAERKAIEALERKSISRPAATDAAKGRPPAAGNGDSRSRGTPGDQRTG